jgi:hypothetical protein
VELHEALRQIDAIRTHVTRAGVFRGYKAATVGCTGLLALAVAALQPLMVPEPRNDVARYLAVWIGVAVASVAMVAAELTLRWLRNDSPLAREQTVRAVEQFAPCVIAGAALTWGIVWHLPEAAAALPGLWAIVFSLGVFASWRQLTPLTLGVAVYYLAAGTACIVLARGEHAFSPLAMAGTFGVGQLLTAAVLYLALEGQHGEA